MQPALPSNVQSNLLSVGMRVRKSVPEGYKTGGMSAFKLWSDNTPARAAVPAPSPATSTSSRSRTVARASNRELLPFCGINNVGGLDVQPGHSQFGDDNEDEDLPPLDSLPELTMSQESTDSDVEPSRKRFLDDEEGDTDRLVDTPQRWQDGSGPRSLMPMGYRNTRAMASARFGAVKSPSMDGQENMAIDEDFDEADFLVFSETTKMDTV
jgi:hypothetical protein